jgi:hypothetical protein
MFLGGAVLCPAGKKIRVDSFWATIPKKKQKKKDINHLIADF